jgi:hypothetical protein
MLKNNKDSKKAGKRRGGQYLYDGLTGKWKYYPKGTFPDEEKLAEFNAEQKALYREHHESLFNKNKDGSESPIYVIADVDQIDVSESETKTLDVSLPKNPEYEKKKETMRILYSAKVTLHDSDYELFKEVFVEKTVTLTEKAKRLGVPRMTLSDHLKSIEKIVFSELQRKKK